MVYDFDAVIDRASTASTKWVRYGPDVLPFWVADMDFKAPPGLLAAVEERLRHGILGYTDIPPALEDAFIDWLADRFGWSVPREWLVWLPGVVPGLNLAGRTIGDPGQSILVPVPVYYPFLSVPGNAGKQAIFVDLGARTRPLGHGHGQARGDGAANDMRAVAVQSAKSHRTRI